MSHQYYYRKKRFRWHNVKRLQGHLTCQRQWQNKIYISVC